MELEQFYEVLQQGVHHVRISDLYADNYYIEANLEFFDGLLSGKSFRIEFTIERAVQEL